jgi:hypothetical protein
LQDTGVINVGTPKTGESQATWATLSSFSRKRPTVTRRARSSCAPTRRSIYADVMRLLDVIDSDGYANKALVAEDVVD